MRSLNIANSKKRDAAIGIESPGQKEKVRYVLKDGSERKNISVLKSTMDLTDEALVKNYDNDYVKLGNAIIESDPEVDMEKIGKIVGRTRKLYLDKNNRIVYQVNLFQVRKNPKGEEIERKDLMKIPSNINTEVPIQWSGRKFPRKDAVKKFVFSRKYQLKHISGLTFDFLYNMAKELQESDSMMLVGAGEKGIEPLILTTGGDPYRGFLEGRVDGKKYSLILHLTNMELKGVENEAE